MHVISAKVAGLNTIYIHVPGMDDITRRYTTYYDKSEMVGKEIRITEWTKMADVIHIKKFELAD